jgi:hypothetical protein
MAKKMTLKGMAKRSTSGWGAVLAAGILMTALAMLDLPRDGSADSVAGTSSATSTADGSTGCQLQVTSAELRVRSGPSIDTDALETLTQGAIVDGTTEVTDGFRKLEGDRWAANEYLVPVTGSAC